MNNDTEIRETIVAISHSMMITNSLLASILDVLLYDKPDSFREDIDNSLQNNIQGVMNAASENGLDSIMGKLNQEKSDGCGHCE